MSTREQMESEQVNKAYPIGEFGGRYTERLIRVTDDTTGKVGIFSGIWITAEYFGTDFQTLFKHCQNGCSYKNKKFEIVPEPED